MKKNLVLLMFGCSVLAFDNCCADDSYGSKSRAEIDIDQNQRIDEIWQKINELESEIKAIKKQSATVDAVSSDEAKPVVAKSITNDEAQKIIDKISSLIDEDGDDDARQEAKQLATDFVKNYPQNLYAGQAHFYLGKILLDEQNHGEARSNFIKSVEKNPNGAKAEEALYRLIVCLSHKENGKLPDEHKTMIKKIYQQLSLKYPNGEYTLKAQRKLKRLELLDK